MKQAFIFLLLTISFFASAQTGGIATTQIQPGSVNSVIVTDSTGKPVWKKTQVIDTTGLTNGDLLRYTNGVWARYPKLTVTFDTSTASFYNAVTNTLNIRLSGNITYHPDEPAPTDTTLPLDVAASAGWSLRRVRSGSMVNAVNIRRSTDNATTDIGFDGTGFLDTTAFKTFIGAGNGYVVTWYDQSGNGRHATQATAANQPQLMLNVKGNRPALRFDGTDYLTIASSTALFNHLHQGAGTVSAVVQNGVVADPNAIYAVLGNNNFSTSNRGYGLAYDDRASQSRNNAALLNVTNGTGGTGSGFAISTVAPGAIPNAFSIMTVATNVTLTDEERKEVYINGTLAVADNGATGNAAATDASFSMQIGASGTNALPFNGYMGEIIIKNVKVNSTERATLLTNQNTFWTAY